jgi:hypothetical protein
MTIPQNLSISIDLNKIDEKYVIAGKNGARYVDLKLVNSPDNEYGSDYFVSQGLPKAQREAIKASGGEWPKTPIVGNGNAWQVLEGRTNDNKPAPRDAAPAAAYSGGYGASVPNVSEDMPF